MVRPSTDKTPTAEVNETSIEQTIESLFDLDHAALKERWRALRGGDPPKRLSRQLLLRAMAYAMQEKAYGGLSPTVRHCLQRLAAELQSTGRITSIGRQPKFKSGTRLIREWRGQTHEVMVLEHGFQWNCKNYRSLSAIARVITGTRWNGHVFFGLKSRQSLRSASALLSDRHAVGAIKAANSITHRRHGDA